MFLCCWVISFFFNDTATTETYTDGHTLSLHDAPSDLESTELDPAIADVERDDLIGRGPLVIALDRTKTETRQIDGAGRDRPHQTAVVIAELTDIHGTFL